MTPNFSLIPRNQIIASRTNPRKHFAQAPLDELAASIKASGIHQPVLLRPLPASRLSDTVGLKPRPAYELVAGERRFRAAGIVAQDFEMPCIIRELTDSQVIDIQLTENMQREDLTHLEESDGIVLMMQAQEEGGLGLTADQVAQRLGKSKRTIFARLSLQSLCPEARSARYEAKIDDARAFEISRIPTQAGQAKALKQAVEFDEWAGQPKQGVRALRTWIQRNVMLQIEMAPFDTGDLDLPNANAHKPCDTCPSNSANCRDLFDDEDAPAMCLDATCWQAKDAATVAAIEEQYSAKGYKVISGDAAKKLLPHGSSLPWDSKYQSLAATVRGIDKKEFGLRKALGKRIAECEPVAIVNIHFPGEVIEAVNAAKAQAVLEELGLVEKEAKPPNQPKPDFSPAAREKVRIEQEWEAKAATAIKQDLIEQAKKLPLDLKNLAQQPKLLRLLFAIVDGQYYDSSEIGPDFIYSGIEGGAEELPDDQLPQAFMRLLFVQIFDEPDKEQKTYFKELGIDLQASEQRIRARLATELEASMPKAAAQATDKPPKSAKPKSKSNTKATAEEAQAGIAAALQAAEPQSKPTIGERWKEFQKKQEEDFAKPALISIGDRVTVTTDKDSLTMAQLERAGKSGTVKSKESDGIGIWVSFAGRNGREVQFNRDQLSLADQP